MKFDINKIIVPSDKKVSLQQDFETDYVGKYDKKEAKSVLKKNKKELSELQEIFMSGVNPQGCHVSGFKQPSKEELDHNYLWRHYKKLPERGQIGIFNRSHYENVLVTKVHPEYILGEQLPNIADVSDVNDEFWARRYRQINDFEREIHENGTHILKFFLNVSKDEQKQRFLDRLNEPDKNWKFSSGDLSERVYWNDYQKAYEDMLNNTSTEYAPWHVIPADNKWFSRVAIGEIIIEKLKSLNLKFPPAEDPEKLAEAKRQLESE